MTDRAVELTNLDRVVFPDDGFTKGDVVEHYERVAELALPHLADRPLVLQRFPQGIGGEGFYQKNTPDHVPDWIRRVELRTTDGGSTTYSVVDEPAGLVYLANQGTITFHTLLAGAAAPDRPVELIVDLDPDTASGDVSAAVPTVQHAAREVRAVLDDLGLAPRVKSSGSRGLHIVVDVVDENPTFRLTRTFARRVAELVAARGPFTLEHRTSKREGRLFLDVLRNGPANHAVAPYSLRPLPGAPVAIPLDWDEALSARFHPQRITLSNVARRLAQKDDPWAGRPRPATTIAAALDTLDDTPDDILDDTPDDTLDDTPDDTLDG